MQFSARAREETRAVLRFPSGRGAAGESSPGGGFEHQRGRHHMAPLRVPHRFEHHPPEPVGGEAWSVARHQEETAATSGQLDTEGEEPRKVFGEPPYFPVRTAAEAGRVEDHGVVAVLPFEFPAANFIASSAIQRTRADATPDNSALRRAQGDDISGSIDVNHLGPPRLPRQSCCPRCKRRG